MEQERDWEKEMAEVDRLLKKLPAAEPTLGRGGAEATVRRPTVPPTGGALAVGAHGSSGDWIGTWARVLLGLLVGIGVAPGIWPYTHGCGLRLIFYLSGVTTVIAAGLWASLSSWKRRLGVAHIIAQLLIVWGVLLFAREVLPRVGAKAQGVWLCPDVSPPTLTPKP